MNFHRILLLSGAISISVTAAWANIPTFNPEKAFKPEKPSFKNWGLVGDSGSKADIHALDAWKMQKGNASIVVAIPDTGIDSNHPDLKNALWKDPTNPSVYGWDFVNNQPNPEDFYKHGTHIAGIIAGRSNNEQGTSGVAPGVVVLPIRYYSDKGGSGSNLKNSIQALRYAVDHGAQIINYSGGGADFIQEEFNALKYAQEKGVLVVAAAGNNRKNTDQTENFYYPAAYRLTNIVSVAATDPDNRIPDFSNWGRNRVDVAAPGTDILSTLPGGGYGKMSGTSQATAFVSGISALILSEAQSRKLKLRPEEVREILISSVDRFPSLDGKLLSGGRVNAYASLLKVKDRDMQLHKVSAMSFGPVDLMRSIASLF